MKRPIAELITVAVRVGAEAEHARTERAAWQILRRKPGYVTHRIYQRVNEPLEHLIYSEWESIKAADGARRHLERTPLMRRARELLTSPAHRVVVDLVGPVTSTKGLDLPEGAVAAAFMSRVRDGTADWRDRETQLWKALANQPGHITHLLFRGFEDARSVGSLSHWTDTDAFHTALGEVSGIAAAGITEVLVGPLEYVVYTPLRS